MDADDIPADFPIRSAGESLEYDTVTISGNKFILPTKVDMRMRDGKVLLKNLAEFRLYNKFGADTSIQFDVPDAGDNPTKDPTEDPTKDNPPKDKSNPSETLHYCRGSVSHRFRAVRVIERTVRSGSAIMGWK